MRVTMFDRWLLMGALFSFCLVGAADKVSAVNCDNKCRHATIYQTGMPTNYTCFHMKKGDCSPCDAIFAGNCDDKRTPGKGDCLPWDDTQEWAVAKDCDNLCVPPLGGAGEATGGTPGTFTKTTWRVCQ